MFKRSAILLVAVSFLAACIMPKPTAKPTVPAPATRTPTGVPTIQVPTCSAPPTVTDAAGVTYEMVWAEIRHGAKRDYVTDTTTYHYLLADNGFLLVWEGSDRGRIPQFDVMQIPSGTLFLIPLQSQSQRTGPLFFFVCLGGGAFVDDSRVIR